ncbi:MAG: hypothetical protein ACKVQB_03740 [Bacteroidia bacterium]
MKSKIHILLNSKWFATTKKIVLVLVIAAATIPFQNCGPGDEPDPIIVDTTKKVVTPINYFKFNGVDKFNLVWDSTNMNGSYKVSNASTTIFIEGFSSDNTTKNEKASIILKFPGKILGTFKHSMNPITDFEISITRGSIETKYTFDDQISSNDMIVTITKYDPVGGHIKGTFSGNLASGITTATIAGGTFDVVRWADE